MSGYAADRSRLFSGGNADRQQAYAEQTRSVFEEENNRKTAELSEQVQRLKDVAVSINGEVTAQNDFLSSMEGTFGRTGQLMSGTLKKLQVMINTGGSKHMCYLIVFVVGIFFLLYFLLLGRG